MSNNGDAASVALAEEVWGVTLMRYLSVMGMVVVQYDWLLTLDDEVGSDLLVSAISPTSQNVHRCASSGRGSFTGQKLCTTSIAI